VTMKAKWRLLPKVAQRQSDLSAERCGPRGCSGHPKKRQG
jgi:hypothetical protein